MNSIFVTLSNTTHDMVAQRIYNLEAITTSLPNSENFNSQRILITSINAAFEKRKSRVGKGVVVSHSPEPRAAAARSRT